MIARRAPAAFAVLLALTLAACGAAQRVAPTVRSTGDAAVGALNALADSFATWDAAHQDQIVAAGTTAEGTKAAIAAYRTKRAKIYGAFVVAYTALFAVATALPLAEADEAKLPELVTLLTRSVDAVAQVKAAIDDALTGGP